jgi:hypothetical protein
MGGILGIAIGRLLKMREKQYCCFATYSSQQKRASTQRKNAGSHMAGVTRRVCVASSATIASSRVEPISKVTQRGSRFEK